MRICMNDNNTNNKTTSYAKLMLYSVAEKFMAFQEVLLPEYKRFLKTTKIPLGRLYRIMHRVSKRLAYKLRRIGVIVIKETPFATLRNNLFTILPYNQTRLFQGLAVDLYKMSKFEAFLKEPFCNPNFKFDIDYENLKKHNLQVQVEEVDLSIISSDKSDKFEQLKSQAEKAFKPIENKEDLSLFFGQFFNFVEDINDCLKLSRQEAC